MSNKKHDLAIVIGRFQPFHKGHESLVREAYRIADNVLIIIGSAHQARTPKNPFTYQERVNMITEAVGHMTCNSIKRTLYFADACDYIYEDTKWIAQIQSAVTDTITNNHIYKHLNHKAKVAIVGHDKDESTFYLKFFPMFDYIDSGNYIEAGEHPIDATQIRNLLWEGQYTFLKGVLDYTTYNWITTDFVNQKVYETIVDENVFIQQYREQWEKSPYPVSFQTVDAVLVQGGHILLVQRGAAPGKGLWALPGGFIDNSETAEASVLRELREETKIKVPLPILKANITYRQRFDHPGRSLRGRTITEAFLIELPGPEDGKLPRVKGSDDAVFAKWFPINDVLSKMSECLFEDHHSIISMLTARAK